MTDLEFSRALGHLEATAEALYHFQQLFDAEAKALHRMFEQGAGSDEQREIARDHLEDANLVPHRRRA